MTDEQIKKALECCSKEFGNCEGCPYDDDNSDCVTIKGETLMIKDALDLINRKDAKIELLTMDVNSLTSERDALQEMVKEQKAKIEQLERNFRAAKVDAKLKTSEIERLKEYEIAFKKGCALSRCINKGFIQNEAYKEFAERLHQKCKKYPYTLPSVFTNIEITYKELTQNLHETCTEGGNEDGTNHS